MSKLGLVAPFIAALLLVACSDGGDKDSGGGASVATVPPQATQPPTAQATATRPPARPAVVTQTMLGSLRITPAEVQSLYGNTPFMQSRSNVTDVRNPFASSQALGDFLASQNPTVVYNAWAATAQCTVCGVQVPAMFFATDAVATAAYDRIREVNQMIFQNVSQAQPFSSYWDASFCQNGTFTGGQTLNWLFCAARKGNAVFTVAMGGFSFPPAVADTVRAFAGRLEAYLKMQFP